MSQALTGLDALLAQAPASRAVEALHMRGRDALRQTGLPGRKTEAWKYTRVKALTDIAWAKAPRLSMDQGVVPSTIPHSLGALRIVLVNGRFDAGLSQLDDLPSGVTVSPLPEAMSEDATLANSLGGGFETLGAEEGAKTLFPMVALNDACFEDGVVISIADDVTLSAPIVLSVLTTASEAAFAAHPRVIVQVGERASGVLVEEHEMVGGADSHTALSNTVIEMSLGAESRLGHYRVTDLSKGALSVTSTALALEAGSHYDGFTLSFGAGSFGTGSLGAGLSRCETRVVLQGDGAEAVINGAYLGTGDAHIDNTTQIDHAVPNCVSRENFRGVVTDRARGVFQGRVLVRPVAQNTDGHQMHKALLLSDKAEIDAKPELEIYADDVRCSHGATTGALDPMHLFYLRARGIAEQQARALLIEAFLVEAVDLIQDREIRETFRELITNRLEAVSLFDAVSNEAGEKE